MKVSPLEVLITRACEPTLHEPNYAVHLEVADYINQKKANNPREAAMMIARLANNRNPHIAILALALLDTLVQSCGYLFHRQISTKEFLNELVRRFPERPPPFPGPLMSRILELIHTWKETICTESRWKEDLGNIRDMHRLLTFKGYRFRDLPRQQPSTTTASNLKTAEELEEEDRAAQSAKLQELIRRGTPRDLAAAQELMKSLSGANPEAKPDYRTQALNDLNKLEQKVILLNEMLDNVDTTRGEKFVSGDVYDQVASILTAARPKIQKWISDAESHDSESLDTFLQMNDQMNTVLNRYEAYKKGDYTVAANPIPAELAGGSASNDLSLIDLDDSQTSSNPVPPPGADDLTGLFSAPSVVPSQPLFNPMIGNMSMGMNMGSTPPITTHSPMPMPFNQNGGAMLPSSMSPPQSTATPPASIMLPSTPLTNSPVPNYFRNDSNVPKGPVGMMGNGMGMGASRLGSMGMQTMQPQQNQHPMQPQQQQQPPSSTTQVQGKDPFADLAGLF